MRGEGEERREEEVEERKERGRKVRKIKPSSKCSERNPEWFSADDDLKNTS